MSNGFLPHHRHTPIETKMRQGKKGRKVETKTRFSEQIFYNIKKNTLL